MKSLQKESMQNRRRNTRIAMAILFVLLVLAVIAGLLFGSTYISIGEFITNLSNPKASSTIILTKIRLPRVIGGIMAGIGLALSGVILQSLTQNELVSSQTIGISSGAGFVVVFVVSLFGNLFSFLPLFAFLGAFLTSMVVYLISKRCGNTRYTLILAGIAIGALFQALMKLFYVFYPDSMVASNDFLIGSLANVSLNQVLPGTIGILIAAIVSCILSSKLDVLALGDEYASSLGLPVQAYRFVFLIIASILASSVISFAGVLGFVGLIVPHIGRRIVGNHHRTLLIFSGLFGALLVVVCDLLSRVIFRPYEVPCGILIAILGVPFFIYILLRRKHNGN